MSQPDFDINRKNLRQLNYIHPNWNHQNNKGENALILLAKRGELFDLRKVMKDLDPDLNLKDKDHKYFTHYLLNIPILNKKPAGLDNDRILIRAVTYIKMIKDLINENPEHFNISKPRLENLSQQWKQTLVDFEDFLKKDSSLTLKYSRANEMINKQWNEVDQVINEYLIKSNLEKSEDKKSSINSTINRMK